MIAHARRRCLAVAAAAWAQASSAVPACDQQWRSLALDGAADQSGQAAVASTRDPRRPPYNLQPPRRTFCSSPPASDSNDAAPTARRRGDGAERVAVASTILRQVAVRRLCSHLDEVAAERNTIGSRELASLIRRFHVAQADSEVAKIVDALQLSGIILCFEDKVYLNAEEVATMVVRALPDTASEAQEKCTEIREQLKPLQQQFEAIEETARARSSQVAYWGLGFLVCQLGLFIRLTYWELSWDVMEPVSYFTGQAGLIAGYIYYLQAQRDFGYEQHFSKLTQRETSTLVRQRNFNLERYHRLKADLRRWETYSKALSQPPAPLEAPGPPGASER